MSRRFFATLKEEPSRITLEQSPLQMVMVLSEGNPDAISVLTECMTKYESIDPQAAFKGYTLLLDFDNHHIYGSNIWIVYKDVCGQDMLKLVTLFRAVQLGIIPISVVKNAMSVGTAKPDFKDLYTKVRAQLSGFNPEGKAL